MIGQEIGVGEDELHAFIGVETTGSGFDEQGRPRILFERHKFYKFLSGAECARAVKAGLANERAWGLWEAFRAIPKARTRDEDQ